MKAETSGRQFAINDIRDPKEAARLAQLAFTVGYQLDIDTPHKSRGDRITSATLAARGTAGLVEDICTSILLESVASGSTPGQLLEDVSERLGDWAIDPNTPVGTKALEVMALNREG